jgi:hypothetical protein
MPSSTAVWTRRAAQAPVTNRISSIEWSGIEGVGAIIGFSKRIDVQLPRSKGCTRIVRK